MKKDLSKRAEELQAARRDVRKLMRRRGGGRVEPDPDMALRRFERMVARQAFERGVVEAIRSAIKDNELPRNPYDR